MRVTIVAFAGLVLAALSVPSLDAAQTCGGLSMDPACTKPSAPRPNVTFGQPKQAPAVPLPTPDARKLATVQELLAAWATARELANSGAPAIDCKMVVNPTTAQTSMPVVRPTPYVKFSMRVVPIERCPGAGR